MSGLIWCSQETNDAFYSEWEKVQPASYANCVTYYDIAPTTAVIKPKDLWDIREQIQTAIQKGDRKSLKSIVVKAVREKQENKEIKDVICQIDNVLELGDLHTLYDSEEIKKVVEGYAKTFSGMYWNYIDEEDSYVFQVPSLMILDSKCMNIKDRVNSISLQKRRNGVDKKSGIETKIINKEKLLQLLNREITLEEAVQLLKWKRDFSGDENLVNIISEKIQEYPELKKAEEMVDWDLEANKINIIYSSIRPKMEQIILENTELQEKLRKQRQKAEEISSPYMIVYIDMIEEANRQEYLEDKEPTISIEAISKIPGVKQPKSTKITEWFERQWEKSKEDKREK